MFMGQGQSIDAGQVAAALSGRSVVLVGMMGAGKTSVGKRLAAKLGLPFVDADAEIEAGAQLTISEIFERFGEALFPRGRAQGDRPPAQWRTAGAGDRRRRVHECDDARQHRQAWPLDLAEAEFRRSARPRAQEVQSTAVEDGRSGTDAAPAARGAVADLRARRFHHRIARRLPRYGRRRHPAASRRGAWQGCRAVRRRQGAESKFRSARAPIRS